MGHRMGHPDHVFSQLRVFIHCRDVFVPSRLGASSGTCGIPRRRPHSFPVFSEMACCERTVRRSATSHCRYSWQRRQITAKGGSGIQRCQASRGRSKASQMANAVWPKDVASHLGRLLHSNLATIDRRECHDVLRVSSTAEGSDISVYVFYMAGLSGNANLVSSSIQYVIFVAMNVPAMFFIDTWGRRNMLLWGSAGMGICNFIVGVSRLEKFDLTLGFVGKSWVSRLLGRWRFEHRLDHEPRLLQQGGHRMQLPLHRNIRFDMGARCVGLRV